MKILNQSRQQTLVEKAHRAERLLERMRGLIGRPRPAEEEALILVPCQAVHTFFMSYPLDVIFFDREGKVVKTVFNLKPFSFTSVIWKARGCVELAADEGNRSKVKEGDQLRIENAEC